MLIINFAPKVLCSKRILPRKMLENSSFQMVSNLLGLVFFFSTKQAFARQGIVKTSLPLVFAFCLAF